MKTYRLVALLAAVLITVSLMGVFSHDMAGDAQAELQITAAGGP